MKIKYKFSAVWVAMAFIWLLISLFLLNNYIDKVEISVLPVILFLPVVVIIYYMSMPLINYISFDDQVLQIHKSFIVFKYKVPYSNLDHCNVMNKDFVVFTKDENVYPIHMDWMRKEDMLSLFETLSKHCRIEDKEKKVLDYKAFKEML